MNYINIEKRVIAKLIRIDDTSAVIDCPGVNHKIRRHTLSAAKFNKIYVKVS